MQTTHHLLLLRHGQTDDNIKGICQGQREVPLNETGRQQARDLAAALLAEEPIDQLIASDLLRARQTAEIIAAVLQRPLALEPGLRERGLGKREGTFVGLEGIWTAALSKETPAGGETMPCFRQRVHDALNHLPRQYRSAGHLAIVTHGGPLRTILQMLHDGDLELMAGAPRPDVVNLINCSIMELECIVRDDQPNPAWRLRRVNDVRHLKPGFEQGKGNL